MQTIHINRVDAPLFKNFIECMKTVDSFIYLKALNGYLQSTSWQPTRNAVKYYYVDLQKIMQSDEWDKVNDTIIISFFEANRVLEAIKHFGVDQIQATLSVEQFEDQSNATELCLYNDELKINIKCSDPALGQKEMNSETWQKVFNTQDPDFSFTLDSAYLKKLIGLFSLDEHDETVDIQSDGTQVTAIGEQFNIALSHEVEGQGITKLNKSLIEKVIDRENTTFYVFSDEKRVAIDSLESNVTVVLSSSRQVDEEEV